MVVVFPRQAGRPALHSLFSRPCSTRDHAQLRAEEPQVARSGHLRVEITHSCAPKNPKWPGRATSVVEITHSCAPKNPKWPGRATSVVEITHSCAPKNPSGPVGPPPSSRSRTAARRRTPSGPVGPPPPSRSRTAARRRTPSGPVGPPPSSRSRTAARRMKARTKWPGRATSAVDDRAQLRAEELPSGPVGPPPPSRSRTAARRRTPKWPGRATSALDHAQLRAEELDQVARSGHLRRRDPHSCAPKDSQVARSGHLRRRDRAQLRAEAMAPKWPGRATSVVEITHSCAPKNPSGPVGPPPPSRSRTAARGRVGAVAPTAGMRRPHLRSDTPAVGTQMAQQFF